MLEGGVTVQAVRVAPGVRLVGLAETLALPPCQGTIAVVGGAKGLDVPEYAGVRAVLRRLMDELVDLASERTLAVIDGGTPYGVMRLLGEARAARGSTFPLVGVAPLGKVAWPDRPSDEGGDTPLDVNRSAFVLVESGEWGGETDTLAEVAHVLAGDYPTFEILVNGGKIAKRDVRAYLQLGGQLVVIEETGRLADDVAQAVKSGQSQDPDIQEILAANRTHVVPLNAPPGTLSRQLRDLAGW